MMRRKYETVFLAALSIATFLTLSWWGLDRALPVDQRENVAMGPVVAGEDALIRSTVIRNRRCFTTLERYVFDAARIRFVIEPQSFSAVGPLGVADTFSQHVPIPANARPGEGTVRFVISWQCNPLHSVWPIVSSIDLPITILASK